MIFFAHHGALSAERELGQEFQIDVEIQADLSAAIARDDLSRTVDYAEAYDLIKQVVTGAKYHLLESLARAVLDAVAGRYHPAGLTVRVRKPHPPISGPMDCIEIELSARDDQGV
jgi:dihydroneopterin aldolase